MKTTKTLYWIFTILFAALMVFSSIGQVMASREGIEFMTHLGYPAYFSPFIGWLKILGVIAILIPGYPRIKEWAYAGLFFDLVGAVYSMIAVDGFQLPMLSMFLWIAFGVLSYVYYYKTLKA